MSRFNPRRSFRDGRTRELYLAASREGWTHRLDGAGHLAMASPDGKHRMSLSLTASAARSALNNEAVFKRWQRMQTAIDHVGGTTPGFPGITFNPPTQETQPMGADLHNMSEAEQDAAEAHDIALDKAPDEDLIESGEMAADEEANPPLLCADGCGRPVKVPGGYARGHHPNTKAQGGRPNGSTRREPSLFKAPDDRFNIGEVIDIANYAGNGSGLVEIRQLEKGLRLIQKMRGNA